MEHVVQLGITIDDEAIKRGIIENAERVIIANIEKDVHEILVTNYGYRRKEPTVFLINEIDKFLEKNRDDILEMAAEKLADKLSRTKKAKEMLSEVLEKI